ncbi:MAG: YciI family protein [Kofleriaceae bacterium]
MQYLLLIYDDEAARWALPAEESARLRADYVKVVTELVAEGKYKGGNPLYQTKDGSSVRIRDGKTTVTDGPFAETREQLGGYFLIEAADMTEARAIAARLPGAQFGTIEVRPVVPM